MKNTGLYKVNFRFDIKTKLAKENFIIEPMKFELDQNQERII